MWRQTLITPDTALVNAMEVIDRTGLQIALVVNDRRQLLGTVTDGDIRRAILHQIDLSAPVIRVMNREFCWIEREHTREKVISLMNKNRVRQMPVLDRDGRVIGLEIADELLHPLRHDHWVILMAGGSGKRLQPLTVRCPKPLLAIGGRPILETILENFIAQGFHHFFISIYYHADMIKEYFGDGSRWGVEINYLQEKEPLGTAGALGLLPAGPEQPLIMMNGDILTTVNFTKLLAYHHRQQNDATVCIREECRRLPYGVVSLKGELLEGIEEKPYQCHFVNAGIYLFNPDLLAYLSPGQPLDIPDLLGRLLSDMRKIGVFPIREYWVDIGRPEDLQRAGRDFQELFP